MIFAPERMVRLDVLTLREDAERLTSLLAREGSVHLVERELPTRANNAEKRTPSAHEQITRLASLADVLLQRLDTPPLEVPHEKRESFLNRTTDEVVAEAETELSALREAIDGHLRQRQEVDTAIAHLNEISEQMHLLNDHGLSFLALRNFRHFHAVCGTVDRAHVARLASQFDDEPCALVTRPVYGKGAAVLLIADRDQAERFDALLKDAGAHSLHPPDRFVRSFEEALEQVEIELWQQRDRLAELTRDFDRLRTEWLAKLSDWVARLHVHSLLDDALSGFDCEGTVTAISGFVPASRQASLVHRLEHDAKDLYFARFEETTMPRGIRPPTRLRNWRLFRPFELFVKTYGLPGYNDIDPTPFVAISFLAMFGMMFGDVGHGLILAAIGACIAYLPYAIFLAFRDLGRILLMAGLSGTLFGFLFGSVFGVEEDAVLPALWMRPSHPEHLTTFLGVALGLGVLVLSTGIILNIVQAVRQRNLRKACLGQWSAASLVFFWSLLALCGLRMTGHEVSAPPELVAILLATPLFLIAGGQIFFYVRDRRRHAARAGSGAGHAGEHDEEEEEELATILFEPIEIVMNLFTNSVSFLRVAAFGLAHAALTTATFVIKDMIKSPGVDFLSMPVEHLFIILLEGMIVTIQCLRLEYYEFFSKFFVGNGVAYAPLTIRADGEVE